MSGSGKKGSSSSKGGVTTWFTCPSCRRRFPRVLSTKHSDAGCEDGRIVMPFIRDVGTLGSSSATAVLIPATTATKVQNLSFIKCKRLASSLLFVPEELIREAGLQTFAWVIVHTINKNEDDMSDLALRVWPLPPESNVSLSNVMMTKDGFLANNILVSETIVTIQSLSLDRTKKKKNQSFIGGTAKSLTLEIDDAQEQDLDIDQTTFDPARFASTFKTWFKGRLVADGNSLRIRYYSEVVPFRVTSIVESHPDSVEEIGQGLSGLSLSSSSHSFLEVTDATEVSVVLKSGILLQAEEASSRSVVTLKDVGGLDAVIKELIATIEYILSSPKLSVSKGIVLHGHSGTGKSFLIQAICNHFHLTPVVFNEFTSTTTGRRSDTTSINSISKVFQEAISRSPAAIVIENLESLAPNKNSLSAEGSSNFMISLQSFISTLNNKSRKGAEKVIILASATDVDAIDPSLRTPKCFGKEIELPVPSRVEREDVLKKILSKVKHCLSVDDVKEIAAATHGFTGADLQALCSQAAQASVERVKQEKLSKDEAVCLKDLLACLKSVKPSAMKAILVDVPNVRWSDIGGQNDLKFKLKQAIEWPLKHPEAFQRLGVTPPKGILMYGPPGCSKTMIAKAIATESGLNFISVKGSELFSKWVGESEKAIRDVFRKARQVAPCVVFFDEIDSIGGERGATSGSSNVHERVLAQLLVELDGIEPLRDVTIVAATNRPDIIDQALLRPGRLDRIIYVPLPDPDTRREILQLRCKKMAHVDDIDVDAIVNMTEGYSGAELTALCHEAAMKALEDDINADRIAQSHFLQALQVVRPRIDKKQIDFYDNYNRKSLKRL